MKNKLILSIPVILVLAIIIIFSITPSNFKNNTKLYIKKNSSLSQVAKLLKENNIIYSTFLFKIGIILFNGEKSILAGDYNFEKPHGVGVIAYRLSHGEQGYNKIKITIPEGLNVEEIANILNRNLSDFDKKEFIKKSSNSEGYLFPDTYYFIPHVSVDDIILTMKNNFDNKIKSIYYEIRISKRTLDEIVSMASILEEEASSSEARRMISGILWKRIDKGMLLQVDVEPNTYKVKGLPQTPISNPGINARKDALNPTNNPFWYYLADKKGNTHYAVDFEGHISNKIKYLK